MIGLWVSPVGHDRMRLIVKIHFWMLTGNDRMLRSSVRSLHNNASGHHLTIGIGRLVFEEGTRGVHRMAGRWGPASGRYDRSIRSPHVLPSEGV